MIPSAGLAQASPPANTLPLVRVKLYETGVGYFERQGQLAGGASLPVPDSHLDDALSTLVVWNQEGQSRLDGLTFSSAVTEDRRRALAGLPTEAQGQLSFSAVAHGMQGTHVELRSRGRAWRGRILAALEYERARLQYLRAGQHALVVNDRACVRGCT